MKTRMLLALAMLLVLLMAGSVPAAAGGPTVPFNAFYAMHPRIVGTDPQGCNIQQLPGEGLATHLGESSFYSDAVACMNAQTGIIAQHGSAIFTAANGDELIGNFAGTGNFHPGPPPWVDFSGTLWITGGTGRFEGVTGIGQYWGTATFTGTGELYFDGALTKPEQP